MRIPPADRVRRVAALLATGAIVTTGCSRDGTDLAEPSTTSSVAPTVSAAPATTRSDVPTVVQDARTTVVQGSGTTVASGESVVPTFTVVEVPETGVPGLDSTDVFCSSWSRFGGSFQMVSVASAWFADDPDAAFVIEVAAAPVIAEFLERLLDAWPDELASEHDVVADTVFGPFAARADDALEALDAAGASDADLTAITGAWISALAARDPGDPAVELDVPPDVDAVIRAAAADFGSTHPTVFGDTTLRNEVPTPLTDEYLAVECPDQGSLSGGEVGG